MAYNRRNVLKRIIDIQALTLEYTKKGVTQEWVYNNVVFTQYRISRSCYYAYLATNAKLELRKLESVDSMQLSLF